MSPSLDCLLATERDPGISESKLLAVIGRSIGAASSASGCRDRWELLVRKFQKCVETVRTDSAPPMSPGLWGVPAQVGRNSPPSTVQEPIDIDCTYFTTLDTAAAERRHQGSSLLESLLANKGYDMA